MLFTVKATNFSPSSVFFSLPVHSAPWKEAGQCLSVLLLFGSCLLAELHEGGGWGLSRATRVSCCRVLSRQPGSGLSHCSCGKGWSALLKKACCSSPSQVAEWAGHLLVSGWRHWGSRLHQQWDLRLGRSQFGSLKNSAQDVLE